MLNLKAAWCRLVHVSHGCPPRDVECGRTEQPAVVYIYIYIYIYHSIIESVDSISRDERDFH